MEGKILRVVDSGQFKTYLIWLKDLSACGRTYTGASYRNYGNWCDFKIGDHITGLEWRDESRKILDADSPVHLIQ
jgi:hypothetical protein